MMTSFQALNKVSLFNYNCMFTPICIIHKIFANGFLRDCFPIYLTKKIVLFR